MKSVYCKNEDIDHEEMSIFDTMVVQDAKLLTGYKWQVFEDGSGSLVTAEGQRICKYDLQTNEYCLSKQGWSYAPDLLENFEKFKEYIETKKLKIRYKL